MKELEPPKMTVHQKKMAVRTMEPKHLLVLVQHYYRCRQMKVWLL
jgi:hypothetical protein